MQIEVEAKPSFGMAVVKLDPGETIVAEAGAMVAMSPGVKVDTTFAGGGGGVGSMISAAVIGLARKFLAGESMFVNRFKASGSGAEVMLAPTMVGDVIHLGLDKAALTVQGTSYLASSPDIGVDVVWGGFSMMFSGEGAFFLRCHGTGDLLLNAYGAIEKVDVDGSYVVDTGHLVAYEGNLTYKLRRAGGWKSTLLSGEGMVLEFSGKGRLWLQTRNLGSLVSWVTPHLP